MQSAVDNGAFGISADDLYRRHARAARQVARSITRNADDAADAVAEAFAGVLEAVAAGRLSDPAAFRPYLLAATRNAAIDILRRAGRLAPTGDAEAFDSAVAAAGPSDRLVATEDRALVAGAFAELPPRWRAVLWLTEVERLPPREVAPLLGLTANNVAQLAVRARGRLRQRYVQGHVRNHASGDCLEATERLGGLVAGELTTVQANRVRGHLAECGPCRQRLAELDDLGLSLRRAVAPLPLVVGRLRARRWPWAGGRARAWRVAGGPRSWLPATDAATPTALAELVSSPAVQHVAASVTAGLAVLGIGIAVVRDGAPPARAPAGGADVAAPLTATGTEGPGAGPVPASPSTTAAPPTTATTTSTTAVAPAPPAVAPFVPAGPLAAATPSVVAQALVPRLPVYASPDAAGPGLALANPRPSGAPLVLLVADQQPGWVEVLLPVRPNGSTGWVRADQVGLMTHDFRIVVELAAHRLTAYQGTAAILSVPVGVGTDEAPTPGGLYYTTELFEPVDAAGRADPDGPYGPYAYGLSGYSEVLFDFAGGDGQFGIHGTNDPSSLGRDVSHGCIRMSNAAITWLAGRLPLGVPVEIRP